MTIKQGVLNPRPTDRLFDDSPDTGSKDCICSRCGTVVQAGETCIRVTTTNANGEVDANSREYRYCEGCTTGVKYFYCSLEVEYGHSNRCEKQCERCVGGSYEF